MLLAQLHRLNLAILVVQHTDLVTNLGIEAHLLHFGIRQVNALSLDTSTVLVSDRLRQVDVEAVNLLLLLVLSSEIRLLDTNNFHSVNLHIM